MDYKILLINMYIFACGLSLASSSELEKKDFQSQFAEVSKKTESRIFELQRAMCDKVERVELGFSQRLAENQQATETRISKLKRDFEATIFRMQNHVDGRVQDLEVVIGQMPSLSDIETFILATLAERNYVDSKTFNEEGDLFGKSMQEMVTIINVQRSRIDEMGSRLQAAESRLQGTESRLQAAEVLLKKFLVGPEQKIKELGMQVSGLSNSIEEIKRRLNIKDTRSEVRLFGGLQDDEDDESDSAPSSGLLTLPPSASCSPRVPALMLPPPAVSQPALSGMGRSDSFSDFQSALSGVGDSDSFGGSRSALSGVRRSGSFSDSQSALSGMGRSDSFSDGDSDSD